MIFLVLACQKNISEPNGNRQIGAETELFSSIQAEISSSMPTIIELTVQTSREAAVTAEIHSGNGTTYSAVSQQGKEHSFTLGGFPEEQNVSIQLHSESESSGEFEITTGRLEFHPQIFATTEEIHSGLITTVLSGSETGIAIWNTQAELVWSLDLSDEYRSPVQAHYHPASGTITYNLFSADHNEAAGELITVDLHGNEIKSQSTPFQHHAFTPIDQSSKAYLSIDVRETEEYGPVVGDSIVIIDDNGQQEVLFSCWDYFTVAPTPVWELPFYPQGKDWTHASGLTYNEEEQMLTLSLMGLQAVLTIDTEGNIHNVFAGPNLPQTTHVISDPPLVRPHGAILKDQQLLVFHSPELQSRGSILRLDEEPVSWTQHFPSDIHALALGDIHRIDENLLLINFGTAGQLQILKNDGLPILTLENSLGSYFSHATWVNGIYHSSGFEQ